MSSAREKFIEASAIAKTALNEVEALQAQLTAATQARERAEREAAACRRAMEDLSTENNSLTAANAELVEALELIAADEESAGKTTVKELQNIATKALAAKQEGGDADAV